MIDNDIASQSIVDLAAYNGPQSQLPVHSLGKDEFLQMLIAQLRHQDPMNPVDDQSFIADLAQFSSLEQMSNMNETLTENLNWNYLLSQTINNTMATSLIGHQVKAAGDNTYLPNEGNATLNYKLGEFADSVTIDIFDGSGEKVATYTLDKIGSGDQVFEWDGWTTNGERAGAGTYSFTVTATNSNGDEITATPFILGIADGVQYQDGQAYLMIDGTSVPLGDVIEVGDTGEEPEDDAGNGDG